MITDTAFSIETTDRGVEAAEPAAQTLAAELGWDEERTRSEVEHYLRRVQAEIESQQMTEDERADADDDGAPVHSTGHAGVGIGRGSGIRPGRAGRRSA